MLHYTGMGKLGDQDLYYSQNRTLYESNRNGVEVHLFEVIREKEYTYMGQVVLAGQPYQENQNGDDGLLRKVWIFPLRLVTSSNEKKNESVYKEVEEYNSNDENEEVTEKIPGEVFFGDIVTIRDIETQDVFELPPINRNFKTSEARELKETFLNKMKGDT